MMNERPAKLEAAVVWKHPSKLKVFMIFIYLLIVASCQRQNNRLDSLIGLSGIPSFSKGSLNQKDMMMYKRLLPRTYRGFGIISWKRCGEGCSDTASTAISIRK